MATASPPALDMQTVRTLTEEGLLQGGPDYVSIIGQGEDWYVALHCAVQRSRTKFHRLFPCAGWTNPWSASPGTRRRATRWWTCWWVLFWGTCLCGRGGAGHVLLGCVPSPTAA